MKCSAVKIRNTPVTSWSWSDQGPILSRGGKEESFKKGLCLSNIVCLVKIGWYLQDITEYRTLMNFWRKFMFRWVNKWMQQPPACKDARILIRKMHLLIQFPARWNIGWAHQATSLYFFSSAPSWWKRKTQQIAIFGCYWLSATSMRVSEEASPRGPRSRGALPFSQPKNGRIFQWKAALIFSLQSESPVQFASANQWPVSHLIACVGRCKDGAAVVWLGPAAGVPGRGQHQLHHRWRAQRSKTRWFLPKSHRRKSPQLLMCRTNRQSQRVTTFLFQFSTNVDNYAIINY